MMKISANLIFICYLFVTSRVEGLKMGKTYVEINNNFLDSTTLLVHCKSKDDNFRVHHITHRWGFAFLPNWFGGTLFFCSFAWSNRFEWFDIYVQDRDWNYCTKCIWMISANGPCRLGDSGEYDVCYPWNHRH
ncbi:hypothetical protein ACJRO7_026465 [Eucalyptus globulus]|uniref:S-protein homolog n=1 Tax=Eucalyptus globulus TaxID=34317 RepID=A0ABD3JYC7_EUCGL